MDRHEYYLTHKDEILVKTKDYYQKHRKHIIQITNEKRRLKREKLRQIWGHSSRGNGINTEALTDQILKTEGFMDIITPPSQWNFPVDRLAKKNGLTYAVDITTSSKKSLTKAKRNFLTYVDWRLVMLFVKPDHSAYRLVEFDKIVAEVRVNAGVKRHEIIPLRNLS
jgi:hypothetical protein